MSLVLRVCSANLTSHEGFQWPSDIGATVEAPDWSDVAKCGNGLHGWLYGQGDHTVAAINHDSKWLVVEVADESIVMLGGKCKFPQGVVRFVGKMHEAAAYIIANEPRAASVAVIGATLAVGNDEACQVGALGTATAGDFGTATAGHRGTATAGDFGTATAGDFGTATAGYRGTATAGDRGTATAGDSGTATAGDRGTATAGDSGTATAGDSGTATAGDSGTATAGYRGTIAIRWWDDTKKRYRTTIGYVGEDGIEADVAYKCDAAGNLVRAK